MNEICRIAFLLFAGFVFFFMLMIDICCVFRWVLLRRLHSGGIALFFELTFGAGQGSNLLISI
jgi:hypothetical protein